ncbi:F0F1 ATP synthase subunit B' [Rhodovulum sp. DZ06]|uniref:F0F1 ATP synthase subunit B' n=1 Tax=Rhodovulum sp. DZ06 TaxID=3425126 RepID=UPI003D336C98
MAHGAADAAHGATGLPQLDFSTWGSQIPWLIITLLVLYYIISRIALPRIGGVIEERHDAIEDDLDRAAEFKRQAAEAEAAYEKALADARAEAQAIAQATRDEIQKEVDAATAKADAEIAARAAEGEARIAEIRASALESVEAVAAETAEALLGALAPDTADSAAVKAAVSDRLGN